MKAIRFLFFVVAAFLVLPSFGQSTVEANAQKFTKALSIIKSFYVDTTNVEDLTEDAIRGMLKELDPHSVYMSKEELKKANEPLEGNFEGIGIQFNIMKDTILVISPITGGPSEKLGIMAGDKIVKIDGGDATGTKVTNEWVVEHLRGKKGTEVTLSIYRQGVPELLDYTVIRDKIPIFSVSASFMADKETGYIRLDRFSATSMDEINEAMSKLKYKGAKNLILDLRGNSGGYLKTAIELADVFIEEGKTIVYTEGEYSAIQRYNSTPKGNFEKGKVVVLVDEGSASASEIVAGAIQDWDRGLLIGRRTFGKGLVQKPYYLPDGSAMRLTTARYHTPTGRCIQKPYDEGTEKYYKDLTSRFEKGELYHADSIHFPDSLKFYTPGKRLVYGGGGIMPDIFIPADTSANSDYYRNIIRKGLLNKFAIEYIDKNRESLMEKYPDFEVFDKKFIVTAEFYETFLKFVDENKLDRKEEDLKRSGEMIKVQVKALIARNLFDLSAYFFSIRAIDDTYQKALEAISDNTFRKMNIQSW